MNKELMKKMTGILSAIAVTASSVLPAAAQTAEKKTEYDDIVQVIVELYGDPVLAADTGDMGADYLDTGAAKARTQQLENLRHNAFGEILSLYPDAEMDFTYDAVFNGFACSLPRELIDDAEKLSGIKSIIVSEKNQLPSMQTYSERTGLNRLYADTGLTGKGKVIAVIDTELYTGHEMFSAFEDDSFVKLTKDDIVNAAENRGLNFDIDPDTAYVSSKIPYAISLVNDDDNKYTVADEDGVMFHGTHVCGIAAGNRVDPYGDGEMMSGVAPDAQLIFMAGFECNEDSGPSIDDTVAVAGIEDAVKLGADIVSLSFGQHCLTKDQEELYGTVLENADNAGVVVCAAAGNSGTPDQSPEDVDRCIIDSPGFLNDMFTIAAAGTSVDAYDSIELADGTTAICGISTYDGKRPKSEYEFVDCGSGSREEIDAVDLEGKLALIRDVSYMMDLYEVSEYAVNSGAAGLLFCSMDNDIHCEFYLDEDYIVIGTNRKGGDQLLAQEDRHIKVNYGEFTDIESTTMANFSAFGGPQDLGLKPEITTPGEGVLSAAYDGYTGMDGTSMATPFAAGCSALTAQYIEEKGWNVTGSAKTRLIKDLLMNTAEQIKSGNIPYSPRRQGAGLVNMAALGNCCVTMTNNGKAAVCLGSDLGDTFSFDLTLHNYGSEDVYFTGAKLDMISEKTQYVEPTDNTIISTEPAWLGHTSDIPEKGIAVEAGSETTFTVTVTLDPDNVGALNSVFTNGWFAEGYLKLTGADNCSDISVPITGFHGDWNAAPIMGKDFITDNTKYMENVLKTNGFGMEIPASLSVSEYIIAYMTEDYEEREKLTDKATRHKYVVSPSDVDWMYMGDSMTYYYNGKRTGVITKGEMVDENGVSTELYLFNEACFTHYDSSLFIEPMKTPEDGDYTVNLYPELLYSDRDIVPQKYSFGLTIDTMPPSVSNIALTEKDGRKILTIEAKDDNLEGFYIVGTNSGDTKGLPFDLVLNALSDFNPVAMRDPDDPGVGKAGNNHTSSTNIKEFFDDLFYMRPEDPDYNFFDAVPATPDENGCMTFSYDVTDLSDYTVTISDRGYNLITYTDGAPFVDSIPSNIFIDKNTPLSDIEIPRVIYDGKIVSQGWEIFNDETYEWEKLSADTKLNDNYNNRQIRYAVSSEDSEGQSNPSLLRINGIDMILVTVWVDDEILYSKYLYPSPFDMGIFSSTSNSYRVEMEAEGYVTRVLEFDGAHIPDNIDIYLNTLGDINGDYMINVTDISKAAAHVKGKKSLDGYEQAVADTNRDGSVNVTDISKLAAKVKGKKDFA